ncbi:MAG: exo-alpha-sialidase, partial [Bacteroidota bacterium]
FISKSRQVYLSWIEKADSVHQLRYSVWEEDHWGEPQTIAQGSNWFVNWADFPSMAATDSFSVAHWLQKSTEGTYDYDITISLSNMHEKNWSSSTVLHQDGVVAEHGFVTLLPLTSTEVLAVWLDGRQTKQESGAMNLYANIIYPEGTTKPGYCLDNRICDCCQTDATLTSEGVIVVYRDRSEDEIRDIYVVRQTADGWSEPYPLHNDGWQIAGCPVNGPAISNYQNSVAVAWFTAADDNPKILVTFSHDLGQTFGTPIRIDKQNPLGRVDIEMLNENTAVVSWMENTEDQAVIRLTTVNPDATMEQPITLTEVAASRASGFPILAHANNRIFCAWTQPSDSITNIQTAWISADHFLKNN